ncbi:NUDIX domain-containing protein [Chloroflexota bacterium]
MLSERHAVTSFLESENEILILLRSERVSTYPGKWAGISGSLDNNKTVDEQAIVEIEEETGLSREHIQLIKKGKPLLFDDEDLKVRKVIYPYLFHIENRNRVKIDWEHRQLKWIKPEDIDKYDTMPKLKETLAQVLSWHSEDDAQRAI